VSTVAPWARAEAALPHSSCQASTAASWTSKAREMPGLILGSRASASAGVISCTGTPVAAQPARNLSA
jgi:hypothetical protein